MSWQLQSYALVCCQNILASLSLGCSKQRTMLWFSKMRKEKKRGGRGGKEKEHSFLLAAMAIVKFAGL